MEPSLRAMNRLQAHRGPDGEATWHHPRGHVGFAHTRLAIIDLDTGDQPMIDPRGNVIAFNGEIYNYRELRDELGRDRFRTKSDTEAILAGYERWGVDVPNHLRGMFAFALWDDASQSLFCARDRFGIKPLYYAVVDGVLYVASETKALLPFLPSIETDPDGLKDYLTFQFCLDGKTLFKGVREVPPAHILIARGGTISIRRYWDVYYHLDWDHTERYFTERIRELLADSVDFHLRADVPVGAYVSGGLDSSTIAALAARQSSEPFLGFTGRFAESPEFDESHYARELAERERFALHETTIDRSDFIASIEKVIYHLDYPVAGPGSFPQFVVSRVAAQHRKVVLGGQGGDEIFGGYVRYLVAYFEQCIKSAIDGTMHNGNFVVTYESIIPNLESLRQYKPMLREFWRDGLFEDLDQRYFRLVDRSTTLGDVVRWDALGDYSPFETFKGVFRGSNVGRESYFDLMTHFDFKTLLPALLQVEDRMAMAHGLESRVPLLDHPLVEFAATIPSNVKFKNGEMKHAFRLAVRDDMPSSIVERKDKMGFPVPLADWLARPGPVRNFVSDVFSSSSARTREFVDGDRVVSLIGREQRFGRMLWGLLSLELWQRTFHDQAAKYRNAVTQEAHP